MGSPNMLAQSISPIPNAQVQPGTITYTTSTSPDGRMTYHPFKAVPASYQTPNGVVSGIQWIPAEATQVLPQGAMPATAEFAASWGRPGHGHREEERALREWQKDEDKRRRREEREASKRRERDREDKEIRRARERDARGSRYGTPGVPGGMAGGVPGYSAYGAPPGAVADLEGRFNNVDIGGRRDYERERRNSVNYGTGRTRKGSVSDYDNRRKSVYNNEPVASGFTPAGYPGGRAASPYNGAGILPPPSPIRDPIRDVSNPGYAPAAGYPTSAIPPSPGRPQDPYQRSGSPFQRGASPYYGPPGGVPQTYSSGSRGDGPMLSRSRATCQRLHVSTASCAAPRLSLASLTFASQTPGPRPPSPAVPKRGTTALSALSISIDTINCIKDAIPNEIVKGLLSTLSGILSTVKSTIRNKEDFEGLAHQCYEVSLLLWRATTASSGGALSGPMTRAVGDLKKSVDGIRDLVAERSQAGVASRLLAVSMDKEKITGWQRDLSRSLQIFNTELNVLTNIKLEEIIVMFERFRREGGTQTMPQGILPPGKPSLFVGRNDLVHEVSALVTQSRHVALVSTGGIGKSSLAKAVLNEPEIVAKFGTQRHFVRYDDMDASQVSFDVFLDRIGGTLGLTLGGSDRLSVICGHLSAAPSLLVLDNAETFLDAAQDKTCIADAVDSLGALASTVVSLTTCSHALPSNVLWTVIAIPALKPAAARKAFTAVFHRHIEDTEVIDSLLQSLDYHPLSINLLAHAARENDWSLEELLDTWNQQQTDLLHSGDGKSQSLIVTLELSLNSPSLKRLGDSMLHVLQIIAFLPQGVDRQELGGLFPSLSGASMIVDAACKQSITY
ncbi:hypothetical protein EWM64_g6724 [Hericium alpestre]|uniref:Uncharacterized protein n=1 Tax=Hericium alpestre TaxID=135208 RepID=A0A4Y9ZSP1_9AGAM|nr:hypothetical protein EWM64_g6724 [Hericium alpestre]